MQMLRGRCHKLWDAEKDTAWGMNLCYRDSEERGDWKNFFLLELPQRLMKPIPCSTEVGGAVWS